MRERPARLIAIVVLLLAAALLLVESVGTTHAADQRRRTQKVFLPTVVRQPPTATQDLSVVHLGLFQTVQTATNSVSLVAGKPTLLRVYARAHGAPTPPVAEVTVYAYEGTTYLGSQTVGPHVVPAQPTTGDLNSTFNFDLPFHWLSGDITLTATIDPVDTLPEASEANNSRSGVFTFHTVAPLKLTIVPIHYTDTRTGHVFADAPHDPISGWLLGAYPISRIDVSYHPPFAFHGDLRQPGEWQRLLNELTALWAAELGFGSATVYYGLIPTSNAAGGNWFAGGVSGLGWIGQRVSLGIDVGLATGNAAGHELGHNFGRRHAPCGNPNSVDPHYPYPNATIGVYGVDTEEDIILAPGANFDMMSYCGPEWVSDYTYEALLNDQRARSAQAAQRTTMGDGLLLRATLDGETATAQPAYRLSGVATRSDGSGYTVQLLDAAGEAIATHEATVLEAEETGVVARLLVAHVPAPAVPAAAVRFLRNGQEIGRQMLATAATTAPARAELAGDGERRTLTWDRPDVPALVRVSADGVQWTTLAIDVTGGRLEITREQLPDDGQLQVIPGDGRPALTVELD